MSFFPHLSTGWHQLRSLIAHLSRGDEVPSESCSRSHEPYGSQRSPRDQAFGCFS